MNMDHDPHVMLMAMLAVADHARSDDEAHAAVRVISSSSMQPVAALSFREEEHPRDHGKFAVVASKAALDAHDALSKTVGQHGVLGVQWGLGRVAEGTREARVAGHISAASTHGRTVNAVLENSNGKLLRESPEEARRVSELHRAASEAHYAAALEHAVVPHDAEHPGSRRAFEATDAAVETLKANWGKFHLIARGDLVRGVTALYDSLSDHVRASELCSAIADKMRGEVPKMATGAVVQAFEAAAKAHENWSVAERALTLPATATAVAATERALAANKERAEHRLKYMLPELSAVEPGVEAHGKHVEFADEHGREVSAFGTKSEYGRANLEAKEAHLAAAAEHLEYAMDGAVPDSPMYHRLRAADISAAAADLAGKSGFDSIGAQRQAAKALQANEDVDTAHRMVAGLHLTAVRKAKKQEGADKYKLAEFVAASRLAAKAHEDAADLWGLLRQAEEEGLVDKPHSEITREDLQAMLSAAFALVKLSAKAKPSEGKWITIGGHPEGGKQHAGGFPVQISGDGKILKGRLKGYNVSQVKAHFDGLKSDHHRRKFVEHINKVDRKKGVKGAERGKVPGGAPGSGGQLEGEASGPEVGGGVGAGRPAGAGTARRFPATKEEADRRIERYSKFFEAKGLSNVSGWLNKLRDHVAAVGTDEALKSLNEEVEGQGQDVGYIGHVLEGNHEAKFIEAYLNRAGVQLVDSPEGLSKPVVSVDIDTPGIRKRDTAPAYPLYKDKLAEAQALPGLERSEDLGKLMGGKFGAKVQRFTPGVLKKLNETYGEGQWVVKSYGEEAFAGYGIYFPQRVQAVHDDAVGVLHSSGDTLAKYGFEYVREEPYDDGFSGTPKVVDPAEFVVGPNVGGQEQDVYYDGKQDRYSKVAKRPEGQNDTVAEFLERHRVLNAVWPELRYKLEGVTQDGRPVITMNAVGGEQPTDQELDDWLWENDWEPEGDWKQGEYDLATGPNTWKHTKSGVVVSDVHVGNWRKLNGKMIPIDVDAEATVPLPPPRADGRVVAIRHSDGNVWRYGTQKYNNLYGDVRAASDAALQDRMALSDGAPVNVGSPASNEAGVAIPEGRFMGQPAFKVAGVSDEDRAGGVTIKAGQEGRVHITTKNGKATVIPYTTWLKKEPLPVVMESDDTRAMAKAALDAVNAVAAGARAGQMYAPDIVKTPDGYRVVELNPADPSGGSGYLQNNPMVMDAYVAHVTGREPAHVKFVRSLLTKRNAGLTAALTIDAHGREHKGRGAGGGQFTKHKAGDKVLYKGEGGWTVHQTYEGDHSGKYRIKKDDQSLVVHGKHLAPHSEKASYMYKGKSGWTMTKEYGGDHAGYVLIKHPDGDRKVARKDKLEGAPKAESVESVTFNGETGWKITKEYSGEHAGYVRIRKGMEVRVVKRDKVSGGSADGRSGSDGGIPTRLGGRMAGEVGGSGAAGLGGKPSGKASADRVPTSLGEVNHRLNRYSRLFEGRGMHEAAGWMEKLREHVNASGVAESLAALGEDAGWNPSKVQYAGHRLEGKACAEFVEAYLNRAGISLLTKTKPTGGKQLISTSIPGSPKLASVRPGDEAPTESTFNDKLEEAKKLPGLEASQDLSQLLGRRKGGEVEKFTPEVIAKLDETFGEDAWIVKPYDDDAYAGKGVYFPHKVRRQAEEAESAFADAVPQLAKYGFRPVEGGIKHTDGAVYKFGTPEYKKKIFGDVRYWGDRLEAAASNADGVALELSRKGRPMKYMAQPAFPVVGISEEERAAGVTIKKGVEGRVHVSTKNGRAVAVPHATWLKDTPLPVVFEDENTRAMAQAAVDAVNALPKSARQGQLYAPDVVPTAAGYRVVEANPTEMSGGSGYLGDNPLVMDAYVSHKLNRDPAHVRFIRSLLTKRKAGLTAALAFVESKHKRKGKGEGGGQFTSADSFSEYGEVTKAPRMSPKKLKRLEVDQEPMKQVKYKGISVRWGVGAEKAAKEFLDTVSSKKDGWDVPEPVLSANSTVIFTKQHAKDDAEFAEKLKWPGFETAAAAYYGSILVYRGEPLEQRVFAHESGHNFAFAVWGTSTPDIGPYFSAILAEDKQKKGWVTEYAKKRKSMSEDFAEAVMLYSNLKTRKKLKKDFPLRYEALEGMLRDRTELRAEAQEVR